jgi:hypothetical protein
MLNKTRFSLWILCASIICAGCAGNLPQIGGLIPKDDRGGVNVEPVAPVDGISLLEKRSLELRNCQSKEDLHKSLATEAQVACTIQVANTAIPITTGAAFQLSPEMRTNIEKQVKDTYQAAYDEAQASVEQKEVVVPIGRIHKYTIFWKQQVFKSSASFSLENISYTVPYTYTLEIPRITISEQIACTA